MDVTRPRRSPLPAPPPTSRAGTSTASSPATAAKAGPTAPAAGRDGDASLAQASSEARARLSSSSSSTRAAPWAVARGGADGLVPGLSGAARLLLQQIGVKSADVPRLVAGETVLFTQPTKTGDDTIGTLRVRDGAVEATIISVHDVGGGVKALLGFREQARALGRALGCGSVELGGAAVINAKLEEKLQRLGFLPGSAPVPDELGNVDEMMVYKKTFVLDDDAG